MAHLSRIAAVIVSLGLAIPLLAQDDDVSLGDLARSVRRSKTSEEEKIEEKKVIDNDNFSVMMDKAESARLNGKPVFSIDPVAKTFTMTSTDGTCRLSFDARATSLNSTPYIASDLPQDELVKLEGPARISDGRIEVSVHNGTAWELKEIVVGITVLQPSRGAEVRDAMLTSAADSEVPTKLADSTVLYHLKGAGTPGSIATFRGVLGGGFGEANSDVASGAVSKDWHWAIVAARGIPPASPLTVPTVGAMLSSPGTLASGMGSSGISLQLAAPPLNSTTAPPTPIAK